MLLGLVVGACKHPDAAHHDAGIDALGVVGGAGGGVAAPAAGRDAGATGPVQSVQTGCNDFMPGVVELTQDAGIDTACSMVLASHRTFSIGRKGGPMLNVMVVHGDAVAGKAYALEGNKVVGRFFNKKQAEELAAMTYIQADLHGIAIPKDKGLLGMGTGTITFTQLPPAGSETPFEAKFELWYESSKVERVGNTVERVKTGMSYHLKGSIKR